MKKLFIILITVFSLLPFCAINASAEENYYKKGNIDYSISCVNDSYGIFDSEEERLAFNDIIQQEAEKLDMNIFILIASPDFRMSDRETEVFADDNYDRLYGEDTDGVFYFMDFTGKTPAYDYISTSGKAVLWYKPHIDDIFRHLDNYLPPSGQSDYHQYKDDIEQAILQFLDQLDKYSGKSSSYYHDVSSGKYFYYKGDELYITKSKPFVANTKNLVYSIPIGILAGIIFFFATKSRYKFRKSANPYVYIAQDETHFTRRDDIYLRTHTTKTKIERNSGSHSSGGGHHSSGGHGGGGHHR